MQKSQIQKNSCGSGSQTPLASANAKSSFFLPRRFQLVQQKFRNLHPEFQQSHPLPSCTEQAELADQFHG